MRFFQPAHVLTALMLLLALTLLATLPPMVKGGVAYMDKNNIAATVFPQQLDYHRRWSPDPLLLDAALADFPTPLLWQEKGDRLMGTALSLPLNSDAQPYHLRLARAAYQNMLQQQPMHPVGWWMMARIDTLLGDQNKAAQELMLSIHAARYDLGLMIPRLKLGRALWQNMPEQGKEMLEDQAKIALRQLPPEQLIKIYHDIKEIVPTASLHR
ncbi:MAG: hypothetical protein ACOYK8_10020 [Alphaproteobacteria bacterium]